MDHRLYTAERGTTRQKIRPRRLADQGRLAALGGLILLGLSACSLWPRTTGVGVRLAAPTDGRPADPNKPVVIEALGSEIRLMRATARDSQGNALRGVLQTQRYELPPPLSFGETYRISLTYGDVGREPPTTREFVVTTPIVPRLEGPQRHSVGSDGTLSLHFDRPVGQVEIKGPTPIRAEPDPQHRAFRILPIGYPQGQVVNLNAEWSTPDGIRLPPLTIQLETPPALNAQLQPNNATDVGLALPLDIRFSEDLRDRDAALGRLKVRTKAGDPVTGQWRWTAERRARFTPVDRWPASTEIEVTAEPGSIRSLRGGTLDQTRLGQFSTGAAREIFVYLDAQKVAAVENGKIVRTFRVSTGKPKTPTVTGSYYIYARYPLKTMRSEAKPGEPGHYIVENVPYAQYFHADYALHGAWWHNGFGHPASHGCVNMATRTHNRRWPNSPEDAGWLYQWAALGVPVTVMRREGL
ncbi:MAG: L,D-transpeptidase [Methylotetracoccus sp.]